MRTLATGLLALTVLAAAAAGFIAPYESERQFTDFLFAPPMTPHVVDDEGGLRMPFVYRLRLVDRLERRYEEDRTEPVPIRWFSNGKVFSVSGDRGPLLLLGGDSFGRDVFSRLVEGARISLGVAMLGAFGALLIGALVGGLAGYLGGAADTVLMRLAEFVFVLPVIYVVLALRAVLPLVLDAAAVFSLMVLILALVGWPHIARGVRAIVGTERRREYFDAAVSLGAGHVRLLTRHLLPATTGFLITQGLLLIPAFILAEATLSYLGLGFAEPTASWGAMLSEASNVRALAEFPWVLSPAAAIVIVVLALNVRLRAAL